jgi:hypothetical protein
MAYQKNFAGVPFKTLLDKAHKDYNLAGVDTEILQFPCAENGNMAIFRATVLSDGATFSAHGDADPNNTTIVLATCGYDSLDDVRPQDFRRVHDALKAKHTEIEEKRAATKLTAN